MLPCLVHWDWLRSAVASLIGGDGDTLPGSVLAKVRLSDGARNNLVECSAKTFVGEGLSFISQIGWTHQAPTLWISRKCDSTRENVKSAICDHCCTSWILWQGQQSIFFGTWKTVFFFTRSQWSQSKIVISKPFERPSSWFSVMSF